MGKKMKDFQEYDYYEDEIDKGNGCFWQTRDGDKEAYYDTMNALNLLGVEYEEAIPIDGGYALYIYLKK